MDILPQVKKTIAQYGLLARNDSILVALSGGPDSVALLHLLARLAKPLNLNLAAIYVNHGLRPRAAAKEERFCQSFCDRLGLELDIVREDIPALARKRGSGIEAVARQFRYDLFDLLASEEGHNRIALGHHLDDQAETIIFRIIRGSGPTGLRGIPARRGQIIRPLHDLTKAQILAYLKNKKLDYCLDRSNDSTEFSRNWIRHKLLPDIRKRLNPQVDQALINLSKLVEIDHRHFENLTKKARASLVGLTPGGKFELVLRALSAYDGAVRKRLLRDCLKELSKGKLAPDRDIVERLDRLVLARQGKLSLPGPVTAEIAQGRLYLYHRKKLSFRQPLKIGQPCRPEALSISISSRVKAGSLEDVIFKARSARVRLDFDKLALPLRIRSIEVGDRFQPLGMMGSKKVGDYLTDVKVPNLLRNEVLVVCDNKGIVWVVGFQIDDRVKLSNQTRKVMFLEFRRRKKH